MNRKIIDQNSIEHIFDLAEKCIKSGNRPMPAILIKDNKIRYQSYDEVIETYYPTMHGEIAVIRKSCSDLHSLSLRGFGILCFCEPCIMCCGAIHWAKIDWVAYCLSQTKLKELSKGKQKPGVRDYLPLGKRNLSIYGPIEEEKAYDIATHYNWVQNSVE